ncbi:MAG: zinc-binding dehydrogenase [Steroidobacteraceae bacterium]|jgi:alcohol dehydrogenase|nr:zinc-binding dehydrogenase [Steroidobacteraceae bacterium]
MTVRRLAWRIDRAGSLDRLRLVEETLPPPAAGEARVRVHAVGLNFADAFACLGLYSATPEGSFVPGLECAGVVEAVGPAPAGQPPRLAPGDRVVVLTRFGGYATALNVDARYLHPIPPGWDYAHAAAWPVQGLTAWYGLVRLGAVREGHVVLVQSAAGGVGLQALAILRALGARPLAVVGRPEKVAFLGAHAGVPAESVIVRGPPRDYARRLDDALRAVGARGIDVAFDAVLGPWFEPTFARLAPEGRYVLYGAADFMTGGARPSWPRLAWRWLTRPRLDPLAMISTNRGCLAFNLIWLWDAVDRVPEAYAALQALSPLPPHVHGRRPFDRAPEALRELQSGSTVGKLVLATDADGADAGGGTGPGSGVGARLCSGPDRSSTCAPPAGSSPAAGRSRQTSRRRRSLRAASTRGR